MKRIVRLQNYGTMNSLQKMPQFTRTSSTHPCVYIIPLGGIGEFKNNLTVIQYKNHILLIDCGSGMFTDKYRYPAISYLKDKHIVGLLLTHGHDDHIGGIQYLCQTLNQEFPIFGTKFTLTRFDERTSHQFSTQYVQVSPRERIPIAEFFVTPIMVEHSIPDSVAYHIETPEGTIFHTGDFHFLKEYLSNPPQNFDIPFLKRLYQKTPPILMLCDSTNAENLICGHTNRELYTALESIFRNNPSKRLFFCIFSSNIERIKMLIKLSKKYNREICVGGTSLNTAIQYSQKIGYLPKIETQDIDGLNYYEKSKEICLITGSQGETSSMLPRLLNGFGANSFDKNDVIIFSASVIPGNEICVNKLINELVITGAEYIDNKKQLTHISGHTNAPDLQAYIQFIHPKYFIPIHGEMRQIYANRKLAIAAGVPEDHIFIPTNSQAYRLMNNTVTVGNKVINDNVR